MADKNPTPDHDDDDWDTGWEDDDWDAQDDDGAEPAPQSPPSNPAQPPSYDVPDDLDDDDEGLLPPPPTDEFVSERAASRPASKRAGARPARVRAAGQSPAPAADDYDDSETFADDTVKESSGAAPKEKKGNGCGLMLLVLVVFGVVIAAAVAFAFRGTVTDFLGGEEAAEPSKPALSTAMSAPSSSQAAAAPSTQAASEAIDEEVSAKCVAGDDDKTKVGNGKGDQKSGPGVIFAFDYAYYVERSGAAARKFMSPELKGTTVETLQDAIDELPEGTQHCLWITPKDGEKDVYSVKLAEYVPDGDGVKEVVHEQVIHTAKDGDKYIIIGIVSP